MSELQVSPERSLRGGPRAARRAVAQLIRLGKSAQVIYTVTQGRTQGSKTGCGSTHQTGEISTGTAHLSYKGQGFL